jgi:uncharacterized protein
VLADTEDVWGKLIAAGGNRYQPPGLVLFSGRTPTACGGGDGAMGPFYCPGDAKVYIDLDFFDTLDGMGAPGDFAQAYVIAHEVGHHLQRLMGITQKVEACAAASRGADERAVGAVELQADCLAGVWAHHSQKGKGWLEQGDIEEAMNAARASATTRCSASRAAPWCPKASPMAPVRSACAGSSAACRKAA